MKMETLILNEERNVKLTAMIQDVGGEFEKLVKRPAVLILPGGGYGMCSDREAEPVAFAYAKAGYQAFVLRYSVGTHKTWPNPLNDYEQAMELIRGRAEEWHVYEDKIAVLGFSAGGHLAACAATISKNRPNAAILGYAALSKDIADMCQPGMPVPIDEVDKKTCPCFLFTARDDRTVPVTGTLNFELALAKKNIAFESHIYAYGNHGFSTGEDSLTFMKACSRVRNWVQDSIEWLEDMFGKFGEKQMTRPACPSKTNGDSEQYLSTSCTVPHLRKQSPEALAILAPVLTQLDMLLAGYRAKGVDMDPFVNQLIFTDILQMLKISQDEILKLEDCLAIIPNIM